MSFNNVVEDFIDLLKDFEIIEGSKGKYEAILLSKYMVICG